MNHLVQQGVVEEYGPLMDVKGSYSAQFEHVSYPVVVSQETWVELTPHQTFLLGSTHKEILSRGDDY
jgi:methionyl aminopeptidase